MKPNVKNLLPGSAPPPSKPTPFVHDSSEPEYDTEQLARRASQVTDVLEHILGEHPPVPDPGLGPVSPSGAPGPPSI
jgi:hypothetical protein